MTAPSCRICGQVVAVDVPTIADAQLDFAGNTGRVHARCAAGDELERLRAELVGAKARAAAAAKLARKAGVPEGTLCSALLRAERRALDAMPRAMPDARSEARIPEATSALPAAAAMSEAIPEAIPATKGAPDVIVNAGERARVGLQDHQQEKQSKARDDARAPPARIPAWLFKAFAQHWAAAFERVMGRPYGPIEGREQAIVRDLVQRRGLEAARRAVDALMRAWPLRARLWWLDDEPAPTLSVLARHLPELLHGPWGATPLPREFPAQRAYGPPRVVEEPPPRPPPAPAERPPTAPDDARARLAELVARASGAA